MSLDFVAYEDAVPTGALRRIADSARLRRMKFFGPMRVNWYVPPEPVEELPPEPVVAAAPVFYEKPIKGGPAGFKQSSVIQKIVARFYGGNRDEMLEHDKIDVLVRPRQVAIYLVTKWCPQLSRCEVGRRFCRDHSTVICALRRVPVMAASDPCFAAQLAILDARIGEALA